MAVASTWHADGMSERLQALTILIQKGMIPGACLKRADELREHLVTVALRQGEQLMREGEMGDALYVLLEGTALVAVRTADGEVGVARLGPGDICGEQGVKSWFPRRRTATIYAEGELQAVRLSHRGFQAALALGERDEVTQRLHNLAGDQAVGRLRALAPELALLPGDSTFGQQRNVVDFIRPGDVFTQGDPAECAFFVLKGQVKLRHSDGMESVFLPGRCFGHHDLAHRNGRRMTAVADKETTLLAVPAEPFRHLQAELAELGSRLPDAASAHHSTQRGTITITRGESDGLDAISTQWRLPDGRAARACRLPALNQFGLVISGEQESRRLAVRAAEADVVHEIGLNSARKIVSIVSSSAWESLQGLCALALDGTPLTPSAETSLLSTGELPSIPPSGGCTCAGLSPGAAGALGASVGAGSLPALCGAGLPCRSCGLGDS